MDTEALTTGLLTLAGTLTGSALTWATSRRTSVDKRIELELKKVEALREVVVPEVRQMIEAFDTFIAVVSEHEAISAERAAEIEAEEHAEAVDRALSRTDDLWLQPSPAFRSRPEYDERFRLWRRAVREAFPDLKHAVNYFDIVVPRRFSRIGEGFFLAARVIVEQLDRQSVTPLDWADTGSLIRGRAVLVNELRSWLDTPIDGGRSGLTVGRHRGLAVSIGAVVLIGAAFLAGWYFGLWLAPDISPPFVHSPDRTGQ